MQSFICGPAGLNLIKQFESLRLTAYQDQVGVWTIGYGHTGKGLAAGLAITQLQADIFLAADVASASTCINHAVTAVIHQNQFDAMVCFTFNLGCAAFTGSTLLRDLNANNPAAAAEFLKWDHAGGKVVRGLLRRRQAEMALFQLPPTTPAT